MDLNKQCSNMEDIVCFGSGGWIALWGGGRGTGRFCIPLLVWRHQTVATMAKVVTRRPALFQFVKFRFPSMRFGRNLFVGLFWAVLLFSLSLILFVVALKNDSAAAGRL